MANRREFLQMLGSTLATGGACTIVSAVDIYGDFKTQAAASAAFTSIEGASFEEVRDEYHKIYKRNPVLPMMISFAVGAFTGSMNHRMIGPLIGLK